MINCEKGTGGTGSRVWEDGGVSLDTENCQGREPRRGAAVGISADFSVSLPGNYMQLLIDFFLVVVTIMLPNLKCFLITTPMNLSLCLSKYHTYT